MKTLETCFNVTNLPIFISKVDIIEETGELILTFCIRYILHQYFVEFKDVLSTNKNSPHYSKYQLICRCINCPIQYINEKRIDYTLLFKDKCLLVNIEAYSELLNDKFLNVKNVEYLEVSKHYNRNPPKYLLYEEYPF